MAVDILEEGSLQKMVRRCEHCNALLSYSPSDIVVTYAHLTFIKCPYCELDTSVDINKDQSLSSYQANGEK